MKNLTGRILSTLVALSLLAPSVALAGGPDIFKAQKCNECHSVKAAGIEKVGESEEKAPDLSKVGGTLDKKAIALYLLKKSERNGEKHKKAFQGTTEELKAVAEWLETLK